MPEVDVDALLGTDPLVLRVRGKEYVIHDLPVRVGMILSRQASEADQWLLLEALAEALGISREEMESWGTAAAMVVVREIMDHFSARLERAGMAAPAREERPSPGATPSSPSSDTLEVTP